MGGSQARASSGVSREHLMGPRGMGPASAVTGLGWNREDGSHGARRRGYNDWSGDWAADCQSQAKGSVTVVPGNYLLEARRKTPKSLAGLSVVWG